MEWVTSAEPGGLWDGGSFDRFLIEASDRKASDVALVPDLPVFVRLHGEWMPVSLKRLSDAEIQLLTNHLARRSTAAGEVISGKDLDFSAEVKVDRGEIRRFRVNATACRSGVATSAEVVLRTIPGIPPDLAQMDIEAPLMDALVPQNGLTIVTGTTGSGKSTLLAGLLRRIRETHPWHMITYEHPIEFNLSDIPGAKGPCVQSEIPYHILAFALAARNANRRAPDVVLLGEARDRETFQGVMELADSGPRVYTTAHTRSVEETPSRIIAMFPPEEQSFRAGLLLAALRLIVHQRLLPKVGGGRVAIRSFLKIDQAVRDRIYGLRIEQTTPELRRLVSERGQTLLQAAERLFSQGVIEETEVRRIRAELDADLEAERRSFAEAAHTQVEPLLDKEANDAVA